MNDSSYNVSNSKFENLGIKLQSNISKDRYALSLTNKDLDEDYKNFNYYLPPDEKFCFFNYKTGHTYHLQEIPVNEKLQNILLQYLKLHPHKKQKNYFLLVNYEGQPFEQVNDITRILNHVFKRKIGCSMLRSIYLTDKFKKPLEILKETASNMGTSSSTISNNYVKIDNK
jgi:hypothetical protein